MKKHVKHLEKRQSAEAIGWIGALFILSSYALSSFGIANSSTLIYNAMMLVGSAGLAVVTYRHRAFQSVMVNVAFVILATIALLRLLFFSN